MKFSVQYFVFIVHHSYGISSDKIKSVIMRYCVNGIPSFTVHERVREQLSHACALILNAAKAARSKHLFSSPQSSKPSSPSNPQLCHFHNPNNFVPSTPLPPHLAETNLPTPLSLTTNLSTLIVSSRDNETPHPQLFDLRPQSLQTRTGGFPSTPPRRRVGTRGDGIEPGVSGQCSASSRVEGRQEFGR